MSRVAQEHPGAGVGQLQNTGRCGGQAEMGLTGCWIRWAVCIFNDTIGSVHGISVLTRPCHDKLFILVKMSSWNHTEATIQSSRCLAWSHLESHSPMWMVGVSKEIT